MWTIGAVGPMKPDKSILSVWTSAQSSEALQQMN